ncbi:MAG: MoaD/ThiS family protein [Chloroflexota bacterium]
MFLPVPLRALAGGASTAEAPGATLGALIATLEERYPGMAEALVDPADPGRVRLGMVAFVDSEQADLGLLTPIGPDAEVHFLPHIAGG